MATRRADTNRPYQCCALDSVASCPQIVFCRSCSSVTSATTPALPTSVWGTIGGSTTLKNLIGTPNFFYFFFLYTWGSICWSSVENGGNLHTHAHAHTFVIYFSISSTLARNLEVCSALGWFKCLRHWVLFLFFLLKPHLIFWSIVHTFHTHLFPVRSSQLLLVVYNKRQMWFAWKKGCWLRD